MALPNALGLSPLCNHIKGHGGLKATVNDIRAALPDYTYVMKTDVKQYYQSIDHSVLLKQLDKDITDTFIWRLLVQFVKRSVEMGGTFKSFVILSVLHNIVSHNLTFTTTQCLHTLRKIVSLLGFVVIHEAKVPTTKSSVTI